MSKELAQTVGGKKFAIMIALLLAFAALATLGNQWRTQTASADVTLTNFWLDEVSAPVATSDTTDDAATLVSPAPVGSTQTYEFSICSDAVATTPCVTGLTAPTAGNLRVIIKLANNVLLGSVTPSGGPTPTCTGSGTDTLTCTYAGPVPAGTIANLTFVATLNGSIAAAPVTFTVQDLGSAQGAVNGTEQIGAIVAFDTDAVFVKTAPGNITNASQAVSYTLTFANPTGANFGIGTVLLADTISDTAFSSITAVTPGASFTCLTAPALSAAPPVAISCSNTAIIAAGAGVTAATTITITGTVSAQATGAALRVISNTGVGTYPGGAAAGSPDSDLVTFQQAAGDAAAVPGLSTALGLGAVTVLRHHDIDAASENAAGNTAGFLIIDQNASLTDDSRIDDPDDATGSLHQVCLVANGNIGGAAPVIPVADWQITTTSGAATVDLKQSVVIQVTVGGNLYNVPCVQWTSAQTGNQSIRLVASGAFGSPICSGSIVDFNGASTLQPDNCVANPAWIQQPLIKEWNTIDTTKIVVVGGSVGAVLGVQFWTLLNGAITSIQTSITVDSTAGLVPGSVIKIDLEQMTVSVVNSGTTLTVVRGAASTIPATHLDNAPVSATLVAGNQGELDNWIAAGGNIGSGTSGNIEPPVALGYPVPCVRDTEVALLAGTERCYGRTDVQGTTISVGSAVGTVGPDSGLIIATPRSFIEYATGSHVNGVGLPPNYNGPIDGVRQTFTISGTCGNATVEDPVSGISVVIDTDLVNGSNPAFVSVLNSDKGVGFTIAARNGPGTRNCRPGDITKITISSREDVQLRSDLDTAPDETITITWVVAGPLNKQPLLAWAGQRVVLEFNWRQADLSCPSASALVAYYKQAQGPGAFQGTLLKGDGSLSTSIVSFNANSEIVSVSSTIAVNNTFLPGGVASTERWEPNTDCISTAIYESQDPGEVDIAAFGITSNAGADANIPITQQADFLIYYMKFESITIGIVDGVRASHNSGAFSPATGVNPYDATKDKTTTSNNVSGDVLIRTRVKGWFETANPTGREAGKDTNTGGLPAGRWVMPDDWQMLAGGALALSNRPNYDIMLDPMGSLGCGDIFTCSFQNQASTTAGVTPGSVSPVVGPLSLVNPAPTFSNTLLTSTLSSKAPRVIVGNNVVRQTVVPDRKIGPEDAPMPSAIATLSDSGAGYLKLGAPAGKEQCASDAAGGSPDPSDIRCQGGRPSRAPINGGAYKYGIYTSNPYYLTNIPAEPWISQYNSDGSGMLWNTWGSGLNSGEYGFWFEAGSVGSLVWSANGKDACKVLALADDAACSTLTARNATPAKIATNGYTSLRVYTDNHGEAMAYINGDAGLTMDECSDTDSKTANGVVSLSGDFCEKGDKVGKSTVSASVDYPDKRKHYPLAAAAPVTIDWTWGGIKKVTLESGSNAQFVYIVLHVTDRDGFCSVPTTQQSALQLTYLTQSQYDTGAAPTTVESFPLYVRTSASQPVVTYKYTFAIINAVPFFGGSLGSYAGPIVPAAVLAAGGTYPTGYQATTTNTGYPYLIATGAYTLHPVLGEVIGWQLDVITGGSIIETNNGTIGVLGQSASTTTFDTTDPTNAGIKQKTQDDKECQSWIRVSNSLLGVGNVLVTANDPEGTVQFDRIIDFQTTTAYSLSFRWSLVTWPGANNINVSDALKGTGKNEAGNDIFDQVTAVYGWDQAGQKWLGFFPSGVAVPGANDLTALNTGSAYWMAIKGPGSTAWTIASNVD